MVRQEKTGLSARRETWLALCRESWQMSCHFGRKSCHTVSMKSRPPPTKTPIAATPMAFVRAMVTASHRAAHDPRYALLAAGISDRDLSKPEGRITAAQMRQLSEQLMRELDDEALGWFSRPLPWGSYGLLARASISAPNLGIAMKRWCRHHSLLTSDIRLEVQPIDPSNTAQTAIRLIETAPPPWLTGETREFCHVSLLRNLLGLSSWLIDSKLPVIAADFAYEPPTHANAYTILFKGHPSFNKPQTQVLIDSGYLALPIRRDEVALQKMLKNALELTVHAYRKDRLLVDRVKQAMRNHPHTLQNAQTLAKYLNLSERTLHRQLKAEGQSLQDIKNSIRLKSASLLLESTQRSIKQIAIQAGFKDEKSLSRSFKNLTGITPSEHRNLQRQSDY